MKPKPRLPRPAGWRGRLAAFLAAARKRPFEHGPGGHDCGQFAIGAVRAVTGESFFADLEYHDAVSGFLALRKRGHGDHIAAARFLFPEIPAAEALMGDLAVIETPAGPALAIVGRAEILAVAEFGVRALPISAATAILRV